MSRSVNRVILVGNTGADPDVRETSRGTKVAHVSLATNRRYEQDGQEQQRTDWHRLTFWGKNADTVERYLRKGTRIYVDGRIEYGSYERDEVTIPTTDVVVRDFVFLDPGESSSSAPESDGSGTVEEALEERRDVIDRLRDERLAHRPEVSPQERRLHGERSRCRSQVRHHGERADQRREEQHGDERIPGTDVVASGLGDVARVLARMKEEGMEALLSVSRGSAEEARLVILEHRLMSGLED